MSCIPCCSQLNPTEAALQAWFFDHRSQGGGDPRRTSSGKITTTFTLDPSIHFHGNEDKNEILSFVRYRCSGPATQKYRDELGRTASLACLYPLSLTSETCSRLSRCCTRHACLTAFIQSPHLISNVSLSAFLSLSRVSSPEILRREQEERRREEREVSCRQSAVRVAASSPYFLLPPPSPL